MTDFPYTEKDEAITHGQKSPGVITDDEILIRLIHHPEYFDDDKGLGENAISLDDLKSRGFSMDRELHTDKQIMQDRVTRQQANRPNRTSVFQSCVKCSSIREIQDAQKRRAFISIDKPVEENAAKGIAENVGHAEVYSSLSRSPAELRGIRESFRGLLERNLSPWTP